tara:strand:- start:63 stop:896 length:834 start_codon:yes stop_codon:yes gene_type:complete
MNRLLRAVDETERFYSVQDFAKKTPTDMVRTFNEMQQEAFRIQKDMYIRIKDLELLDLKKSKIYEIMKSSGASRQLINNLLSGRFTPVNYSKPRFESKVRIIKDQMRQLSKDSDEFRYKANRKFLFPQIELDKVKSKYNGIKFFPKILNEETGEREGGYDPDNENYKVDKEGRLMLDENKNPIIEEGFIKKNIKKIPGGSFIKENIFDPLKNLIVPGSPEAIPTGLKSKIQTPPLGNTPMPIKMASNTTQKNPVTNLTRNEEALLSPTEKVIASKKT